MASDQAVKLRSGLRHIHRRGSNTKAFSGRLGRAIATDYVRAAIHGPAPAPYPVQRGLTAGMRQAAQKSGDAERMQMWAGQSAKFAQAEPAGVIVQQLWEKASSLLKAPAR